MATCGYIAGMSRVKQVGVRELKNHLSAYLREVRRGVRILVSDRSTVVAELREPGAAYEPDSDDNPVLSQWIREGVVKPASRAKAPLPRAPVSLANGTAARLLAADRGERKR